MQLVEKTNDLNRVRDVVENILKLNNFSGEALHWYEKYGNLLFRTRELNRGRCVSDMIITSGTQVKTFSEIYRDIRNESMRMHFRYNDYKFMVFLHEYLNILDDQSFIDYSKKLTGGLDNLEVSLEGNGKLNKEDIFTFEEEIEQKRWSLII